MCRHACDTSGTAPSAGLVREAPKDLVVPQVYRVPLPMAAALYQALDKLLAVGDSAVSELCVVVVCAPAWEALSAAGAC